MTARIIDRRVRTWLSPSLVVALIVGLVLALVLGTAGAHDVQAQAQPPGQQRDPGTPAATFAPGQSGDTPGQSGEAPGQQRGPGTPAATFAPGQTGDTPGQQQQATRTAESGQSGPAPTATSRPGQGQGATPTPRSDRGGQGDRDDRGSGSGKGIEKLVVSVNGTPVSAQDQGRGQAAPELPQGRDAIFSITVNGTPPGQFRPRRDRGQHSPTSQIHQRRDASGGHAP